MKYNYNFTYTFFYFCIYIDSLRHNSCSSGRWQKTEKNDESANHESSRYKKKEKLCGISIIWNGTKLVTNNSYATYAQYLFVKIWKYEYIRLDRDIIFLCKN